MMMFFGKAVKIRRDELQFKIFALKTLLHYTIIKEESRGFIFLYYYNQNFVIDDNEELDFDGVLPILKT